MREAERLIVGGDSDRSDKNVYLIGGKERAKLSRLPTQLVETVRDAFVHPRGYDQLLERCAKTSTVILQGPAGYGKQGTAMRILLDLGAKPLFQLDPRVRAGEQPLRGAGADAVGKATLTMTSPKRPGP
jgi:hypothetical protein